MGCLGCPHRLKHMRWLLILVGLALAANTGWAAYSSNFNHGILLEAGVAVVFLAFGIFKALRSLRWLVVIAVALLGAVLAASAFLAIHGSNDNVTYDEDAVIVLGAAVQGRDLSPTLTARLNATMQYHQKNPTALIVVTGGQGPDEDIPEAHASRDYLVKHGINEKLIVVEDKSTTTLENFAFARELLDAKLPPGYTTAFVSNEYHIWRAEQTANSVGLNPRHYHCSTRWTVWVSGYLREVVAVALSQIFTQEIGG